MTLAFIIFIGLFLTPPMGSAPLTADGHAPIGAQDKQSPDTAPQAQPSPSTSGEQSTSPTKPSARKKVPRHKKKKMGGCDPAPDPRASGSAHDMTKTEAGTTNSAPTQSGTKPASNCPPLKIVVRHGGATDSSIQLAGGTPGQDSQEQATANQMLQSTEENLKKLEARQLSATEQDTVTQIRQFVEQSKSALAASDPERARTLAWKAQTLSDDLVKPR